MTINNLRYLWWHDFRVIYSENQYLKALCDHPAAYAPLLTVVGTPSNEFTNAYDWSAANATTLLPVDGSSNTYFPNNATGCGQQYANAYLHTVKFKLNNRFDGTIPFICWPNAWGFSEGDNTSDDPTDASWLSERDVHFVRLGRNNADLLPSTYSGQTLDARARGASGYTAGGIAANYTWWTDFWTAAKDFIDTALGHELTPVEIYDGIDFPLAPDLNRILARVNSSGTTIRTFDVIKADPRWSTEKINGFQTWAEFYATLTSGERAQLEDTANTSLFTDALTTVAEKLGVFRDTCTAYQVDQTMVRACRNVFGNRLRFVCEYGIVPQSPTQGTINDRTVSTFTDRVFENRGPFTLPTGWGAAPVSYQLFGLRDNATGGDLDKLALVGGYTRTGGPSPTFGAAGGAAADGRLWNMFRLKENVRRIRTFDVDTVPWWNYIPATGVQTGIVATTPMDSDDHLEVLSYWQQQGVNRFIVWGSPARDFNDDPLAGPLVDYYESDFGPVIDDILPELDYSVSFGTISPGMSIGGLFTRLCTVRVMQPGQTALGMGTQTLRVAYPDIPCSLQAMSTGRSMTYKAEGQTNVWDLFLPTRIENGSDLILPVGVEFVVDGVRYRSVGTGLQQGFGGVQTIPVERLDR